jgi:hypothetical protein
MKMATVNSMTAKQVHEKVRDLAKALKVNAPKFWYGHYWNHPTEADYPTGGEVDGYRLSIQHSSMTGCKARVTAGFKFSRGHRGILCILDLDKTVEEIVQKWNDKVVAAKNKDEANEKARRESNDAADKLRSSRNAEWRKILKAAGFKKKYEFQSEDNGSLYGLTIRGGHEITVDLSDREIHFNRYSDYAKKTDGLLMILEALKPFVDAEVK